MTDEVVARLRTFLTVQLDGCVPSILDLRRIGVGRSRQNWIFDLALPEGAGTTTRQSLILRSDPDGGLVDTDRRTEFELLRALGKTALPVPRARWLDATGEWLGRPALVMDREPGACEYDLVNGSRPLEQRVDLARRLCDLLVDVHSVDWLAIGLDAILPAAGERPSTTQLDHWEAVLRKDQLEAMPEIDLAIDWLRLTAPVASKITLVHADFKSGNVLVDGDRIVALLDWELAHLGDPLEDLGWILQPLRSREHLIAGAWQGADLIAYYRKLGAMEIDESALDWWVVFATFKTAVMQVSGLRAFIDGRSLQPYRPTRRVLGTLVHSICGRG